MPSDSSLLTPRLNISINDDPLTPEFKADLISVLVFADLEAPSLFELRLITRDVVTQEITWVDHTIFDIGNKVKIQMGYEQEIETIMLGEITGLEPEYTQDTAPILVVRGHNFGHYLLRGRYTKSFLQMKDSDIASEIARNRGLRSEITDSEVTLEYVLQHNQTDWDFLQERAKRIGYEFFVDNDVLYFRPPEYNKLQVSTLSYGKNLQEFFPRLSTLNQVGKLEVRGWVPKEKEEVIGEAAIGQEDGTMGGETSGAKAVEKAFGESIYTIINQPVSNLEEADKIAVGQFKNMAIAYISGEGTCQGNPSVRAGEVIEIDGIGEKFSGLYYVSSAEHNYIKGKGYKTSFTVMRNAI